MHIENLSILYTFEISKELIEDDNKPAEENVDLLGLDIQENNESGFFIK